METKKFTDSLHVREYGFWNLENSSCGFRKPGLWNMGYSSRNPESYRRLESRIQVILTNTKIQYLESGIQLKESGIQYLESGIYGVESRIQDCRGFSYMGRADSLFV